MDKLGRGGCVVGEWVVGVCDFVGMLYDSGVLIVIEGWSF